MPTCKKCGKSYSIWTADIGSHICRECKVAITAAAAAEGLKDSFSCVIPDIPLTKFEQVGRELLFQGMGRGLFRDAQVKLIDDRLHLSALGSYVTW